MNKALVNRGYISLGLTALTLSTTDIRIGLMAQVTSYILLVFPPFCLSWSPWSPFTLKSESGWILVANLLSSSLGLTSLKFLLLKNKFITG